MKAGYGQKLRSFFAKNTNPLVLIDFAGQKVFEEATVDVNILLFAKSENLGKTKTLSVVGRGSTNLSDYVEQLARYQAFTDENSWTILSPIEQGIKEKIERIGTPLKDWDININYGIKTGLNEAFIIDGKKKDELIAQDPKSAEIIRPILRGRDVKRYGYTNHDLWLLFIPWHFPLHNDSSINGSSILAEKEFQKQYPAIYNHLLKYKSELSARNKSETGIRYEWYALQRWGAKYWEDFSKQKIIYPNMTKYLPFYYDEENYMTNQKCFIITGEHLSYLTAFFNSSLFKYCFRDNFPELQGGTRELSKIFFEKISVLKVNNQINDEFRRLVLNIQKFKSAGKDTVILEKEIDKKIYEIYNLSDEEQKEIGFVEIK